MGSLQGEGGRLAPSIEDTERNLSEFVGLWVVAVDKILVFSASLLSRSLGTSLRKHFLSTT